MQVLLSPFTLCPPTVCFPRSKEGGAGPPSGAPRVCGATRACDSEEKRHCCGGDPRTGVKYLDKKVHTSVAIFCCTISFSFFLCRLGGACVWGVCVRVCVRACVYLHVCYLHIRNRYDLSPEPFHVRIAGPSDDGRFPWSPAIHTYRHSTHLVHTSIHAHETLGSPAYLTLDDTNSSSRYCGS